MNIIAVYREDTQKPTDFIVKYRIDKGRWKHLTYKNEIQERK